MTIDREPTEAMIDAAAQYLRETQQAGKHLTPWPETLKSTKKKWLKLAYGCLCAALTQDHPRKFALGQRVTKRKGSNWTGRVVGVYSTDLTPIGYAVESETETGSVQIYPEAALVDAPALNGEKGE